MGKGHRYQKHLKSEKAKVKLKTKGSKQLPKGLNITDAAFKVKKIVIREQLKQHELTEILSRRKLNIKDLLTRLQHYNSTVRQDAVKELKELLNLHTKEILNIQLNSLLQGVSSLILDKEKAIRRESIKILNIILSSLTKEQLIPFCGLLVSYLTCAMTHIDQNIMEDSLLLLDILVKNNNIFIAGNDSNKILPYFLDMISKFHVQSQPGRQLTTNLNTKSTSMKWRIKVLNSLQYFLNAIVNNRMNEKLNFVKSSTDNYKISDSTSCLNFPIYSSNLLQYCPLNLEIGKSNSVLSNNNDSVTLLGLQRYLEDLIPLMFDSWIEVSPKKQKTNLNTPTLLSTEASSLLKCITSIIQNIIDYIEVLENDGVSRETSVWFKNKFESKFVKTLLSDFPYAEQNAAKKGKKRQEDFAETVIEDCLEQNIALCHIYIWCTSIQGNSFDKSLCEQVLDFIIDKLSNWTTVQTPVIPQLIQSLKVLFTKTSTTCYKNKVDLGSVLNAVIKAYSRQPKKELQIELFAVLRDIVMDCNLNNLHGENCFKEFITSLPELLLKRSVYDSTIKMLNRISLQYRQWIQKKLETHCEAIIENAKTIEIIGSEDEQNSRLMICNLFYFMSEHVYY